MLETSYIDQTSRCVFVVIINAEIKKKEWLDTTSNINVLYT